MKRNLLTCRHALHGIKNFYKGGVASVRARNVVHPFWFKAYGDLQRRDETLDELSSIYDSIGFKPMLPFKLQPGEVGSNDDPLFRE